MLSLVGPSLRCGLFFPRGDANRIQRRPESPFTCFYIWSSLDQYLNTDSTVCVPVIPCCPIRCDVEILMAPGGKPSCLTTLPAVRHCQSQCEPTDSQTHLQSDGGLRCSGPRSVCLGNWWFEESTPPPTLHEDSLMYGLRGNRAREKTALMPDPLRRSSLKIP